MTMRAFSSMAWACMALAVAPCVFAQSGKVAPAARGGESSVVLQSTITGNQEQPKVLYIVPWQGPGGADQLNTGLQPIVSDVFAPLDRREFQRELRYRQLTTEQAAPRE
jgi:hypothetical protein